MHAHSETDPGEPIQCGSMLTRIHADPDPCCREGSGLDGPDPRDRRSRTPHPRLQFLFSILSRLVHCNPGLGVKGTAYWKGMVIKKMSQRADLNVAQSSQKLKPPCIRGKRDWKLVCRKNNLLTLFTNFLIMQVPQRYKGFCAEILMLSSKKYPSRGYSYVWNFGKFAHSFNFSTTP